MKNDGISVVICCYNSSLRIIETLRYLSLQKFSSSLAWEIVLVDNASTDQTAEIALNYWRQLKLPTRLTVINEVKQGLSNARAKGVKASLYPIIVFCDDDTWLFENYLQTSFEVMQSDELIGAVGGEGIATSSDPLPAWFDKYKYYFACYPQGNSSGQLNDPSAFLFGAGLVTRKHLLEQVFSMGNFLAIDRAGNKLSAGGDNELCYRLRLQGYKLWYHSSLKFYHFMPPQRLTYEYLHRLLDGISYSRMQLVLYDYVLTGKEVSSITWFLDILNRLYLLIVSVIGRPSVKMKFERRIAISTSWSAFLAILHLFGSYKTIYKRLMLWKNDFSISNNRSL
jgi:glycosyltransferase involved in cell wall biosynthesis